MQEAVADLPFIVGFDQHRASQPQPRLPILLLADRSFPQAVGASHPPGADIWVAEVDGVAVLCADRPSPSLLVGPDQAQVLLAAAQLGLH